MKTMEEVWVFRIGALGDALVALPAIERVRELHPNARLVLLTNDPGGPIVDAWDILRHATAGFSHAVHYRPGLVSQIGLLLRIRRARPKALYYLAPTRRTRLQMFRDRVFFGFLGGVDVVRGLDRESESAPAEAKIRVSREADRLVRLVDPSGTSQGLSGRRLLAVSSGEWESVREILREAGWHEGLPLVAVAPGSKMPAKRWDPARFREVGERLLCIRSDLFLVLLGSADEASVSASIAEGWSGRVANLAGRTSLMQSAALMERALFYLGNDTGTMHLAAAMGTPCVAIFSARDQAGKWEPFGDNNRVLRFDPPCAGCLLHACVERGMECLDRIDAAMVESAAMRYLVEKPLEGVA